MTNPQRSSRRRAARSRAAAAVLAVALAAGALMQAAPAPAVQLVGVTLHGSAISIETAEPVAYTVTRPDPLTLVVELRGVHAAAAPRPAPQGVVTSVAYEQTKSADGMSTLRVRIALARSLEHTARSSRNSIRIDLTPAGGTARTPSAGRDGAGAPRTAKGTASVPEAAGADAEAPAALTTIHSVRAARKGTATVVTIAADGRLPAPGITETREHPRRLILEFPNVATRAAAQTDGDGDPVRRVRVALNSQQPPVARVTLELTDGATYVVPRGSGATELSVLVEAPRRATASGRGAEDAAFALLGAETITLAQAMANGAALAAPDGGVEAFAALQSVQQESAGPVHPPSPPPPSGSPRVRQGAEARQDAGAAGPIAALEGAAGAGQAGTVQGTPPAAPPATSPVLHVGVDHHVQAADLREGAQDRPEVHPLEVHADRVAGVLLLLPDRELLPLRAAAGPIAALEGPAGAGQAAAVQGPPPAAPPATSPVLHGPAPAAVGGGAQGQEFAIGQEKKYTGHPISMDFQGVDLRSVLRTFAEISGLNMVIDPDVQGTVDIVLTDVPWDQALEVILRGNALDYTVDGTIVRIARIETLRREQDARTQLAQSAANAGALAVRTYTLSYAKAEQAAPLVRSTVLSARGQVQIDPRTNTLIVTDLPGRLDTVSQLLATLDRAEPQVEIEARIITTTREFARALGVQWGFNGRVNPDIGNTTSLAFPNNGSLGGRAGGIQGPGATDPRAGGLDAAGTAVNLGVPAATSAVGLALGSINGAFNLDLALSALERNGKGRILSTPRVTTQNNVEAEIMQGVQIPVQTEANNTVTVTFKDAALTLKVTPQITAASTVIMQITLENATPGVLINNIPSIDTQRAITRVQVSDGMTTVMGGIFVSREQSTNDTTPVLHRIPLLGWLFKRDSQVDESRELLIFITPRILKG